MSCSMSFNTFSCEWISCRESDVGMSYNITNFSDFQTVEFRSYEGEVEGSRSFISIEEYNRISISTELTSPDLFEAELMSLTIN